MKNIVQRALPTFIFLYLLAIYTTMAGMEFFGWTSMLMILLLLVRGAMDRGDGAYRAFRIGSEIPVWGWFAVGVLAVFVNAFPGADKVFIIGSMRWVVILTLLTYGLSWVIRDVGAQKIERAFRFFCGFWILIGVYCVFQHKTGIDLVRWGSNRAVQPARFVLGREDLVEFWRSSGFYSTPMTMGNAAAMFVSFPLAALLVRTGLSRKAQIFFGLSVVATVIGLYTTYTRGGWLAAAAAIAVVVALSVTRKTAGIVALSALLVLGGLSTNHRFRERVVSMVDTQQESSTNRLMLWRANWEMFKEHPLLGVGYGDNERIVDIYYDKLGIKDGFGGHAHSNYFQILSGTGGLGFVFYIWMMGFYLWLSWRLWKTIPKEDEWARMIVLGAIGAQVAMHVSGLTEASFKKAETNHQFIFILALLGALGFRYGVVGGRRAKTSK